MRLNQRYSLLLGPLWCSLLLFSLIVIYPSAARVVTSDGDEKTVIENTIRSEGNNVTYNTTGRERITVIIHTNGTVRNSVDGDGNTVDGEGNTVDGDGNTIDGDGNTVDGDGNTVDGDGNTVDGDKNTVDGDKNTVDGDGNTVIENTILSEENNVTYNTTGREGIIVTIHTTGSDGNTVVINATILTNNNTGSEENMVTYNNTGSRGNTENNNTTKSKPNTVSGSFSIGDGQNICHTKGCVNAASNIIKMMDDGTDPCEDFERFACGAYQDHVVTPEGDTVRSDTSWEITLLIRNLLKENITDEDSPGIKLVKAYYNSCMDEDSIEEQGLAPLKDILAKLGGWPVIEGDNWDPATYQWTQNVYKIRELGYSANQFLNLGFGSDDKNSSWNILTIFQPYTFMEREYLLKGFNESNIQAYHEYQIGIAELLGADKESAERELKEVIEFETEIAKISLPPDENRNYTARYNKMTLNDLQKLVPDIPWLEYANKMLKPNFSVSPSEPIVIYATDFLKNMTALINKTPNRTLANYIIWDIVRRSVAMLNDDVLDLEFKYEKKVDGREDKTSRRWKCTSYVKSEFAVGSYYIKKYFKDDAKNATKEMVKYIHEAFNDNLQNLDWLDDTTREMAMKKSESIYSSVAYPEELLDDSKISEYYDGLNITEGNFFEQTLKKSKFYKQKNLKKFRTKIDKRNWEKFGSTTQVNAFYSRLSNSIAIHAGILRQGVFFDAERPMYLNYGGIGSTIGHEISHGFDDTGRKYDVNGEVNNWWESETEKRYKEKSKCIIEQYGNFTVPQIDLNVNGKLTAGENIADNGGINVAYSGYKKWIKDQGEEPLLPGLPYTQSQLFWVAAANLWCSKPRPETLRNGISTRVHSPDRYRINGPMMNNIDFSNDFNCPVGSPMNPKNKCKVW